MMARYLTDPETKKLLPAAEWEAKYGRPQNRSASVHTMTEFQSPIDGSSIRDHKQLEAHNRKHGVTNIADYGEQHFKAAGERMHKERIGDTPQADSERRTAIIDNLQKAGVKL